MDKDVEQQLSSRPDLSRIVRTAIYPGVGIARIGNSREPEGFFIGPEVTGADKDISGSARDETGALKRQAARFRIYGYDQDGLVVAELTAEHAQIEWQVHLVNRKAQWYKFDKAMDLPEAAGLKVPLRNAHVEGRAREALAIDPGARSITGCNNNGQNCRFDSAVFMGHQVPLGELRTDARGRLLVLGGFAQSASPSGKPIYDSKEPCAFPNATEWFDDTSDGPVTATVVLNGKVLPVEPAWVVATQPSFAPNVVGWRTLYDLLVDTYTACGWLKPVAQVSFTRHILPVLQRLGGLQWVNKGFASMFGHGAPLDFTQPRLLASLSRSDRTHGQLRRTVFNAFRAADNAVHEPRTWPWLYGDAFGGDEDLPENHLAPSPVRMEMLGRWVEGDFIDDWQALARATEVLEELPLSEQPAMLDRAALDSCVADAFHPGIELTWIMRHATIYRAPFRIKQMPGDQVLPDYGAFLDQATALGSEGPLHAQPPGGLSRWMALPWQLDTVGCRSGYDKEYDPYLPTFWPAQVPNQVLSEADYKRVMDESRPREQRLADFNNREHWLRHLYGGFIRQAMQLVDDASVLGVLESRPGIIGDDDFPSVMQVEIMGRPEMDDMNLAVRSRFRTADDQPASELALAGWDSEEQYEEFCRILKR